MAEVALTDEAKSDLKEIYDYISNDSEAYAWKQVVAIVARIEILEEMPYAGRKVPDFELDLVRELIEGNYRIIYHIVSDSQVNILRIIHGARLLKL